MSRRTNDDGSRFAHAWRALRHRNFRLYFFGQGTSMIGTWMTRLATSWLVYRMEHSAWLLGLVGFVGQIVPFLLQPVAGVWVERLDRRRLLVWTQIAAAVQSLALAALTLAHRITFWEIIWLTALQGLINAFDSPARHSFMVQMLDDREDLQNAIALNSTLINGARLVGPAIAAFLIGPLGEGGCFLIDGISYLGVIASLLMMRLHVAPPPKAKASMIEQMREGWEYVRGSVPLRTLLILFAWIAFMGTPYVTLLPVFAANKLHGGPHTMGWLAAASGAGTLTSAFTLTMRRTTDGLTKMLPIAAAALGAALVGFGLSGSLTLSLCVLAFAGFGIMQVASVTNTVIQSLVSEDKRARVMSYWVMAFFGSAPFGSLLAGSLAARIGASRTVEFTGACCLLGAMWFLRQLPAVSAAVQQHTSEKLMRPAAA